jgi:hypothetical protein
LFIRKRGIKLGQRHLANEFRFCGLAFFSHALDIRLRWNGSQVPANFSSHCRKCVRSAVASDPSNHLRPAMQVRPVFNACVLSGLRPLLRDIIIS